MRQQEPFQHHMLREIYEQPRAVRETALGRVAPETGVVCFQAVHWTESELRALQRVVIAASGTSRHAGLAGKCAIEELARLPVEVDYASEFQYRGDPLLGAEALTIVITQSGETADTLGALRRAQVAGGKVLAIANVADSSIMREADGGIHTKAGPELAVPSTKAFSAQLAALFLFAIYLAEVRGTITREQARACITALMAIPNKIERVLDLDSDIQELAREFYRFEDFLFVGRGVHYPIALDGALKLKEVSYIHAEGYPSGEIKHGPIALIDKDFVMVAIATCDRRDADALVRYEKTASIIRDVKRRSGRVIALVSEDNHELDKVADHLLRMPQAPELLAPILEIVPLQLLAYHIAVLRGCNVDRPRALAKAVVEE